MELDETYSRVSAEHDDEEDDVIYLGSRTNYGEDLESSDVSSSAEHSSACEQEDNARQRSRRGRRRRIFTTGKAARSSQHAAVVNAHGDQVERVCVLCYEGERPDLSGLQTLNAHLGGRKAKLAPAWVHTDCIYYASRRTPNESDAACVTRVIHSAYACQLCKKRRASVGCIVDSCRYAYHLPCALVSGGDFVENKGFYCPQHVAIAQQRLLKLVKWPKNNIITYTSQNIWDDIAEKDISYLQLHSHRWEEYVPSFFSCNLECKVYIQEIHFGHWAYCHNLEKEEVPKQYEVRALVNIDEEELIGEYTGRIRYQKDITSSSHYVANFWYPEGVDADGRELCVDAEKEGNEMRYINSIAPTTAFYIKQNARMSTVWCRGQLRIFMIATRSILKGQPIITDYDEHSSTFFEENYVPAFDDFRIEIPPIPADVIKSGKKSYAMKVISPPSAQSSVRHEELKATVKQEPQARLAKRNRQNGMVQTYLRTNGSVAASEHRPPPRPNPQSEVIVLD